MSFRKLVDLSVLNQIFVVGAIDFARQTTNDWAAAAALDGIFYAMLAVVIVINFRIDGLIRLVRKYTRTKERPLSHTKEKRRSRKSLSTRKGRKEDEFGAWPKRGGEDDIRSRSPFQDPNQW